MRYARHAPVLALSAALVVSAANAVEPIFPVISLVLWRQEVLR
jgi:hypothetical protein